MGTHLACFHDDLEAFCLCYQRNKTAPVFLMYMIDSCQFLEKEGT